MRVFFLQSRAKDYTICSKRRVFGSMLNAFEAFLFVHFRLAACVLWSRRQLPAFTCMLSTLICNIQWTMRICFFSTMQVHPCMCVWVCVGVRFPAIALEKWCWCQILLHITDLYVVCCNCSERFGEHENDLKMLCGFKSLKRLTKEVEFRLCQITVQVVR